MLQWQDGLPFEVGYAFPTGNSDRQSLPRNPKPTREERTWRFQKLSPALHVTLCSLLFYDTGHTQKYTQSVHGRCRACPVAITNHPRPRNKPTASSKSASIPTRSPDRKSGRHTNPKPRPAKAHIKTAYQENQNPFKPTRCQLARKDPFIAA